jgi:hypothetical protein
MVKDYTAVWFAVILTFGTSVFASAAPAQSVTAAALAKLKARLMSADYRADIDELARLRDEVAPLSNDRELGYLAQYWSGFASWRIALNGANHDMKPDDLTRNLKSAATAFYSSMRLNAGFADAYAAASSVNGWLATFYMGANPDFVAMRERISLSAALLTRARELDPENPRVLWVHGGMLLFAPESQGGSITRAIDVYKHMLEVSRRKGTDAASPLPDWGTPEALMSLSYAHTKQTPPDLSTALDEATAALKAAPDWSYVRDNLMPQIEKQLRDAQR